MKTQCMFLVDMMVIIVTISFDLISPATNGHKLILNQIQIKFGQRADIGQVQVIYLFPSRYNSLQRYDVFIWRSRWSQIIE